MSLTLITGSLSGNTVTGSFGQLYPLTDSDIYISGGIGEARFTLNKGQVFGGLALNGGAPFPNDIALVTAYGQSQVLAVTTVPTFGSGSTVFSTTLELDPTGQKLQLKSGSIVLSTVQIYPASSSISSSYAATASFAFNAVSASYALSASFEINYETSSSYADTASRVTSSGVFGPFGANSILSSSYSVSSSYALSASFGISASYALSASYSLTSSFVKNAQTASNYIMNDYTNLNFADDTAAAAGGVPLGGIYRTGNFVVVRLT